MAIVNRNSGLVANIVATPPVSSNPSAGAPGQLLETSGTIAAANDDSGTSIGRVCRVPSNARVSQVLLTTNAAASTAGAIDVGVYQIAENGGAVVDADLFGSAVSLTSTRKENLDVTYESGEFTPAESVQPLWQVLGLTADPQRDYDIAYTITTTFNGGPTSVNLKVRYVI